MSRRRARAEGEGPEDGAQEFVPPLDRAPPERPLCAPRQGPGLPVARGFQAHRDRRPAPSARARQARHRPRRGARRLVPGGRRTGQIDRRAAAHRRDRLSGDGSGAWRGAAQDGFPRRGGATDADRCTRRGAPHRPFGHGSAYDRPPPDRPSAHHASVRGCGRFRHLGAAAGRAFPRQDIPGGNGGRTARPAEAGVPLRPSYQAAGKP